MPRKPNPNRKKKKSVDFSRRPKPGRPPVRSHKKRTEQVEVVGMRLNKYLAHCGVASRRQAAEWVKAGKVEVNGKTVIEPYYQIQTDDQVKFEGKPVQPEEKRVYVLLNKPRNVISTVKDEKGRKTVLDLLGDRYPERIFPVGRLDRDTTGLLLLTNDGDLAQRLTHPRHQIKKVYHVMLEKPLPEEALKKIRAGVTLEDGPAQVDAADYLDPDDNSRIALELHIGRNRIVRRLFEHLGYAVVRLDRVYLGGLTKKDLPRGFHRELTEREVIMLKHFT